MLRSVKTKTRNALPLQTKEIVCIMPRTCWLNAGKAASCVEVGNKV